MTYPRVNLLKKSEQRYQGVVSRQFVLIGIIAVPIMLIALLSAIKLVRYSSIQSNLKSSRALWESLEPRIAQFQLQRQELASNQKALGLIEGWQASKVPMERVLLDIQTAVPENIQLTRLSVRSEAKAAVYKSAKDMAMASRLILQGISHGERAEESVINLRKDLLTKESLASVFNSINLGSLRKRAGQGASSTREFMIEGSSSEGGVR
jgi:hypothetical protein